MHVLEKGINEVFLTCETTAAWDINRRKDLTVELFVKDKK
jgi:hypothetical protein